MTVFEFYQKQSDYDTDGDDEITSKSVVAVDPRHVLGDRVGKCSSRHSLKSKFSFLKVFFLKKSVSLVIAFNCFIIFKKYCVLDFNTFIMTN
jgi:hypothetical protein